MPEEIDGLSIKKLESRSDTKAFSDSKKHFLEIYLDVILELRKSCQIDIFSSINYAEASHTRANTYKTWLKRTGRDQ